MAKLNYRLKIAKQQSTNLNQIKDGKIKTLNNLCRLWNYISVVTFWRQQNLFVKCFVPPKQQWQLFASKYLIWAGDRLFKVFEKKEFSFHSSLPEWKVTSQLLNICKFIQVWKTSPPKRLCEMYKTTNSLRLVYFQVKKTKHLMATRKRAMCFFCWLYQIQFPIVWRTIFCQEIVLTELWVVMSFYYSIKFCLSLSTQWQTMNHFHLVTYWDLYLSVEPENSLT